MAEKINKSRRGVVRKISGEKTVSVEVTRRTRHPLFKKVITITKRFLVHDENNSAKIGDVVDIYEVRPYSKNKSWAIISRKG